jgi:hypothetical protein
VIWDRLACESKSGELQTGRHPNGVAAGAKIAEFSSGRRLKSSDIGKGSVTVEENFGLVQPKRCLGQKTSTIAKETRS